MGLSHRCYIDFTRDGSLTYEEYKSIVVKKLDEIASNLRSPNYLRSCCGRLSHPEALGSFFKSLWQSPIALKGDCKMIGISHTGMITGSIRQVRSLTEGT